MASEQDDDPLWLAGQVAKELKVHRSTVARWSRKRPVRDERGEIVGYLPPLLPSERTLGGRRRYRQSVVEQVAAEQRKPSHGQPG